MTDLHTLRLHLQSARDMVDDIDVTSFGDLARLFDRMATELEAALSVATFVDNYINELAANQKDDL